MKKLVTGKTVQDFANENKGKYFPVNEDTLITPNAKDTAMPWASGSSIRTS